MNHRRELDVERLESRTVFSVTLFESSSELLLPTADDFGPAVFQFRSLETIYRAESALLRPFQSAQDAPDREIAVFGTPLEWRLSNESLPNERFATRLELLARSIVIREVVDREDPATPGGLIDLSNNGPPNSDSVDRFFSLLDERSNQDELDGGGQGMGGGILNYSKPIGNPDGVGSSELNSISDAARDTFSLGQADGRDNPAQFATPGERKSNDVLVLLMQSSRNETAAASSHDSIRNNLGLPSQVDDWRFRDSASNTANDATAKGPFNRRGESRESFLELESNKISHAERLRRTLVDFLSEGQTWWEYHARRTCATYGCDFANDIGARLPVPKEIRGNEREFDETACESSDVNYLGSGMIELLVAPTSDAIGQSQAEHVCFLNPPRSVRVHEIPMDSRIGMFQAVEISSLPVADLNLAVGGEIIVNQEPVVSAEEGLERSSSAPVISEMTEHGEQAEAVIEETPLATASLPFVIVFSSVVLSRVRKVKACEDRETGGERSTEVIDERLVPDSHGCRQARISEPFDLCFQSPTEFGG